MDRGKHDEVMDEGVKRSRHGETHPKLGVGNMIPLESIPPIPSSDPGVLIPH